MKKFKVGQVITNPIGWTREITKISGDMIFYWAENWGVSGACSKKSLYEWSRRVDPTTRGRRA